jgi:hypothetical protein
MSLGRHHIRRSSLDPFRLASPLRQVPRNGPARLDQAIDYLGTVINRVRRLRYIRASGACSSRYPPGQLSELKRGFGFVADLAGGAARRVSELDGHV